MIQRNPIPAPTLVVEGDFGAVIVPAFARLILRIEDQLYLRPVGHRRVQPETQVAGLAEVHRTREAFAYCGVGHRIRPTASPRTHLHQAALRAQIRPIADIFKVIDDDGLRAQRRGEAKRAKKGDKSEGATVHERSP